jgi:hypothetical protein
MIAGVCNAFVLASLERIMVQQQVFKGSSMEMAKRICRTEGVRYLFKGLGPTIVREALFAHTAYHSSDKIGSVIHRYLPHKQSADVVAQLGLGAACGALTTPFSRIAVVMQANETKIGIKDAIARIYKDEGPMGFVKGGKERAILVSLLMVGMRQCQAAVANFFEKR